MRHTYKNTSADVGPFELLVYFLCLMVGLSVVGYVVNADILPLLEARNATLVETPASLESASIRRHEDGDGGVSYRLEVRYLYIIDGYEYSGTRLGYGETRWSWGDKRADAEELLAQMHEREPFFVYTDQRYHARAVVFPGTAGIINPITWFVGGIGSIFLFVGFWTISCVAVAKAKRNRASR